ncbi:MAG: 3'-5' exonuclease [Chlamydiales bacterium]|nr:3'-5' exonuclease [Chlamydiales bacterium]
MLGIFLDVESTGLDSTKHRVIEIAFQIYHLPTGSKRAVGHYRVRQPKEVWDKSDPISLEVNGFTWDEVCEGESEQVVAESIKTLFCQLGVERGHAVFICQNPAFDKAFFAQLIDIYVQEKLNWPYHWLDFASMYWTLKTRKILQEGHEWPETFSLSKDSIAEEYQIPKEARPHRAMNGVEHLINCYRHVVGMGDHVAIHP